jgi:hypothetical protein
MGAALVLSMDTYSHVLPALQDELAERIGELLYGTE